MNAQLFTPIQFRELNIKNRIFVSPMCQYSAQDGVPNDWHMVHLGSRAVGGAGLIIVEATGVNPKGRISPGDLGLWNDKQMEAFKPIVQFMLDHGAVPAIQLAHAGRKASTHIPWEGSGKIEASAGGWVPVAPSSIPFSDKYASPHALEKSELDNVVEDFVAATKRSLAAGFQVVEIHMAHGYLLHEFLSPLSNQRQDEYGGSLENRMRLPLKIATAIRATWPAKWPVFVRISATDWAPHGGWNLEQSIVFAKELKKIGIDLIDCSTGGTLARADIPTGPGYQVRFASSIRKETGLPTGAVGEITSARQAEDILKDGHADVVLLAREILRDPYFPLHAAKELGVDVEWPKQYLRAKQ